MSDYLPARVSTMYGWDWGAIQAEVFRRRNAEASVFRSMEQARAHYNGDIVIPLHDVQGHTNSLPIAARLVTEAIDNIARMATMGRPQIHVPPVKPFKEKGKDSVEYAAIKRRALYARWDESALADILLRRAYRHFGGYGTCSFIVVPNYETGGSRIELRNPLGAYPELRSLDDVRDPINTAFVSARSYEWICHTWPHMNGIAKPGANTVDGMWDVVEWIDAEAIVLGVLGPSDLRLQSQPWQRNGAPGGVEVARFPNKAEMVPVAMPRRVTMDRLMGIVDGSIPTIERLERLKLLDDIAAEKAIFGDMVIIGQDGREARLVSGNWRDGRTGIPNELVDGDIKVLNQSPGPMNHSNIDRAERDFRVSTGLIPQTGGETYGGLRTGRAIDAIGGFSVDPRVQEAQEIVARSLTQVNKAIMAVEKGYFGGRTFTVFSGWPTEKGETEYSPDKHFASDSNVVSYSFPGTDISAISVAIGQLMGAGVMSRSTARRQHPLVEDAEGEERAVLLESLADAAIAGMIQQISSGALPFIDQVRIMQLYAGGATIWDAVSQASREAQERQAAEAPAPPPDSGMAMSPEAMPGLAQPGQGVEQLAPTIAPPNQSQVNFRDLTRAVRTGITTGR